MQDSLINVTNKIYKLKATVKENNSKINELNSKVNILESQRQKDQIIIAKLSDLVFKAKLRKLKKNNGVHCFQRLFVSHLNFDTKERSWSFISFPKKIKINSI